jgi:hypothetical protein
MTVRGFRVARRHLTVTFENKRRKTVSGLGESN